MPDQGKVLIFSGVRGDTRRYRALHLYEQLSLAGVDCCLSYLADPRLTAKVDSAAAVVMHRVAYDRYVAKLVERMRHRNLLVVLDADDFLYDASIMRWIDSPDFQDPVRASLYRQELNRHRMALELCDALTVSTGKLVEMLAPFGKPVWEHRNAFSLEMLSLSEQAFAQRKLSPGRVVIGYASGTHTHNRDFALIRPAVRAILERYRQVELWLMGAIDAGHDWDGVEDRVSAFPMVPWRDLPGRLAQLDINLAPLVLENPFNQAKSEIKYMEAALVRVPTIASSTDAFQYAIRQGETGFLAQAPEAWYDHLAWLVEHPISRQAVGDAAHQDVLLRYAPQERGWAYARFLADQAGQLGRSGAGFSRFEPQPAPEPAEEKMQLFFTPEDEIHPTFTELAFYSIRNRGLGTLLGQVWVYLRRKLSRIFPFSTAGAS